MTTQRTALAFRLATLLGIALLFAALPAAAQTSQIERSYRWEYGGRAWTLLHGYCEASYRFYRSLPRTNDYTAYGAYAADWRDNDDLCGLVGALERLAYSGGLNVWGKLNLVISFAQSIPYAAEEGEYPRYPLETLVEMRADCEDAAILTAALLREMGFGVVLLAFLEEHHMAVGVRVLPPEGTDHASYTWNGETYYYLEATNVGWAIGERPAAYTSQPVIIDPQATVAARY